jgi:hypothetical protein
MAERGEFEPLNAEPCTALFGHRKKGTYRNYEFRPILPTLCEA